MSDTIITDLFRFLDASPTAYHAASEGAEWLSQAGFTQLDEKTAWDLEADKGYYVVRNDSSLIAFHTGQFQPRETGFRIISSHTDSPSLRVKTGAFKTVGGMWKTGVEVLGGPILSTWLDRKLSIAGRLILQSEKGVFSRLFRKQDASVMLPNPAIHLNREMNKGFEYNPQKHLSLIIGPQGKDNISLIPLIADELGLDPESVLAADIQLYDTVGADFAAWDRSCFSSGRIDNLAMCQAALAALTSVSGQESITLAALFDNEEVGSRTPHGADSSYLEQILERIVLAAGGGRQDFLQSLSYSFMVSADQAHAVHPNFPDLHDETCAPVLNGGPVVKINANWNYATTGETEALFRLWCRQENVPCQTYLNRSDLRGGKSLGPIAASRLGIRAVDVGNPIWSMHSIRETAGVEDHDAMIQVFKRHLKQVGS